VEAHDFVAAMHHILVMRVLLYTLHQSTRLSTEGVHTANRLLRGHTNDSYATSIIATLLIYYQVLFANTIHQVHLTFHSVLLVDDG